MKHERELIALSRQRVALLEEMERLRAQKSLTAFAQRVSGFTPVLHMVVMARGITALLKGSTLWGVPVQRLMVLAPPRHAKSFYCSWFTPAFVLGWRPKSRLMHITHTHDFAGRMGRRIRNTLGSPEWPWPEISVSGDAAARHQWETTAGGIYNAFGMNGSPTGSPADFLFVDDPLKGFKDADSPVIREHLWEVMKADVWTRLEGPQKQLWALTRWNEDDPSGRVLPEGFDGRSGVYADRETGVPWHVLCMPAICEHDNDPCGRAIGDWLWPDEHGDGKEIASQRRRGGRVWSALYQQRPSPLEGLFFQAEDLRYFDRTALDLSTLAIYGASDYAITEEAIGNDPDYTVHAVFGVDPQWNVYLLAAWRGRTKPDAWVANLLTLVQAWKPILWAEEDGQIIRGVGPFLIQQMNERRVFFARRQFTSAVSKTQRAASLAGLISMHRFHLPRGETVANIFERELLTFPSAKRDDCVDVCSLFARMLDVIMEGQVPEEQTAPPPGTLESMWPSEEEVDA